MSRKGNIKKIFHVTQSDLNEIVEQNNSIRVGSTKDPNSRAKQYERDGYSGTMYVAKTSNMQQAENKLLDHNTRHNDHKTSNQSDDAGYVYVINGRRYK